MPAYKVPLGELERTPAQAEHERARSGLAGLDLTPLSPLGGHPGAGHGPLRLRCDGVGHLPCELSPAAQAGEREGGACLRSWAQFAVCPRPASLVRAAEWQSPELRGAGGA